MPSTPITLLLSDPDVALLDASLVADGQLEDLLERFEQTGRFSQQRNRLRADISEARVEKALAAAALQPESRNRIATQIVDHLMATVRANQRRNPYHREIVPSLDHLAEKVTELSKVYPIQFKVELNRPGGRGVLLRDVPQIADLLTVAWIRSTIEQQVQRYARIADDEIILEFWANVPNDHPPILHVQHQASGLRATFMAGRRSADRRSPGSVNSKATQNYSIDPARPGVLHEWQKFAGLGIGHKLYLRAADLLPDERWADHSGSNGATGVRRKLHRADPFRWQYADCKWCLSRGFDWTRAELPAFEKHL